MTIYLVRHAQSHQKASLHHSEWPLSEKGSQQAAALGPLLHELSITRVYSSPYLRCRETIQPFLDLANHEPAIDDDLQEHRFGVGLIADFPKVWERSWLDFDYARHDGESSRSSQVRMMNALTRIAVAHPNDQVAVSTHGMMIALVLNAIDATFMRLEAEQIRNPEVIQLSFRDGKFHWHREFAIPQLNNFATFHWQTPVER